MGAPKIEPKTVGQAAQGKPVKPEKPKRSPEETAELKRQLMLNINSYHVGDYNSAPLDKLHNHIFQGDGDYVVVNNKIGKFIVKMRDAQRPGLPEDIKGNKISLNVPKIPGKIYYQIIAWFRDICDKMNGAEAFIQVYWDRQEEEYVCHVPEQTVSGGSVQYDARENLNEENRDRYTFVFEVHSHNTMDAFWSPTDNADEKETKFYGVFGKINNAVIGEKFRFMVMGKQIDVKKEHIFDFSDDTVDKDELEEFLSKQDGPIDTRKLLEAVTDAKNTYPEEWNDSIKERPAYNRSYFGGQGTKGPSYGNKYADDYDKPWWKEQADGGYPGYEDGEDSWHFHGSKKTDEQSMMNSYNDDIPVDDLVDIDDTFSLENYEDGIHGIIIETFAAGLTGNQATQVLEALTNHGHDRMIKEYARV